MIDNPFDDFVAADSAPVFRNEADTKDPRCHLLWGDGVEVLEQHASRTKVRARGRNSIGWIDNDVLGGSSLLEIYFIDVGQGDGVLIKTPDFRHIMIDGGYNRAKQDVGKNAADFVDWKFFEDYKLDQVLLDAMIASHNDLDHYGGLWDLLNVKFINELDCESVRVNAFYHAGLAWWKKGTSGRTLGPHETTDNGSFFTQLMGDRPAVEAALQPGAGKRLQGNWSDLMRSVVATKTQTGAATPITRISHATDHLPGFAPPATVPAAGDPGDPAIKVLGPVEFQIGNAPAIRRFTSADSQNTNGNSVLLRIDYGRARILMTGDLNRNSQRALLADYTGERQQFECDVAKACHHGSNDVSYEFLQAMRPAVTVISSGDNEGHDHPRPTIVAASATTGFLSIENDELLSPLIYATEIARSVLIGRPNQLTIAPPANAPAPPPLPTTLADDQLGRATVRYRVGASGEPKGNKEGRLSQKNVVHDLVYGLVNVRTDGETILCATRNESDKTWNVRKIKSRF